MVSTTRGTISRTAAEKAEGKKPATEEGSGSKKGGGSAFMKAKDYAHLFGQMPFLGTRYPDLTAMAELGISEDCHSLFDEMQLKRLMMNPQPAYQKERRQSSSLLPSGSTFTSPTR
ncbi:unnamed protein product [Microthlaspi erraticum]|uniref:Arabidopsis retrotransposon Orf1 C-terminal domain-containing protein n=1 Tax=Microthlaspi erraticum TaxID=1685480 RepID=A0A6D2L4K4_9BRAS|nr:unnamed protein product [Microthlaspi erraticum]